MMGFLAKTFSNPQFLQRYMDKYAQKGQDHIEIGRKRWLTMTPSVENLQEVATAGGWEFVEELLNVNLPIKNDHEKFLDGQNLYWDEDLQELVDQMEYQRLALACLYASAVVRVVYTRGECGIARSPSCSLRERGRRRGLLRRISHLKISVAFSLRTYDDGTIEEGGWDSPEKGMVVESQETDGEFANRGLGHTSRFQVISLTWKHLKDVAVVQKQKQNHLLRCRSRSNNGFGFKAHDN
ncbi:hypothetical protein L6452_35751 [Arctium lappa]|uniref:Uncharacterized protein n=1 Tax=Arctium lappa TaxID=4217 RepID=A0ACB8Y873_ARCLA|nr:hypothetical protein L6452_35751 [Arctium lappa]